MKQKHKPFLVALLLFGFFWLFFIGSSGTFNVQEAIFTGDVEALINPDFEGLHGWAESTWRSAGGKPSTAAYSESSSSVSMSISGYDASFYAVALSQGAGPTPFRWGERSLYVPINSSCSNIVAWRGSMDRENVSVVSCLGMGVDFWFDACLPDGEVKPVELYVFFYMSGAYALPIGSFKHVVRQDYNYSSSTMGLAWDYMYFHHSQDSLGLGCEHNFELADYIMRFKEYLPEYREAEFTLCRVDACMELFYASGSFTIDHLGLQQTKK